MDNERNLNDLLQKISADFKTSFDTLEVDGTTLEVLNIDNMPSYLDRLAKSKKIHDPLRDLPLWAKVWPGSFVLGRFLRNFNPNGKSLLELGAGMGICSLVASRYGFSRIFLTDIEEMALDFARVNVLKNNLSDLVTVMPLDVAATHEDLRLREGADFIVASELLYLDRLHRPIVKFLQRHLAPGGKAFFCTDLARSKPHFRKLAEKHFSVQSGALGIKSQAEDGQDQRKVFEILILESR